VRGIGILLLTGAAGVVIALADRCGDGMSRSQFREASVTKAEWGTKRVCSECGARYYDMRKDPPTCPKCGTVFEAVSAKAKRRPAPPEDKAAAKKKQKAPADLDIESKVLEAGAEDEEDEELIEDASELGEDDEDVSEVIETKVEGEEDVERGR
jgi:uncharacterized protein (TIGR02300 family)